MLSLNCLSLQTSLLFPPTPTSLINRKTHVGPTCRLNVGFDDIPALVHNKVLIAAGVSAAIGQLSKPISGVVLYGRTFDIKAVLQAGGFPSTHSSAVVATATCLALERGFSDSIFGMAVVYASLVMYDAQGVRREVGIHAKTLNKLLVESQTKSVADEGGYIVDSVQGKTSSAKLESSSTRNEQGVLRTEQTATQLLISMSQESTTESDTPERSHLRLLKESIGHTEIEVIAGAFLGFLVSLTVNIVM